MGLMERIVAVLRAKLSRLIGEAEDPGETLDYSYERQLELLRNVKRGVADVVTSKRRVQLQAEKLQAAASKLDRQAHEAMAAGREDLARRALERKVGLERQLEQLGQQVAQLEAQQDKLVDAEQRLAAKVEAFRSQKEVIKAEYSAAEAQVRIGEAATGLGEEMAETGLAIQRARDRTEAMQARAGAIDELIESGTLEDFTSPDETDLDRELARLASGDAVQRELERVRRELGPATTEVRR